MLKKTYNRRIDHFELLCRTASEIVFIHHLRYLAEPNLGSDLKRIYLAVQRRRAGRRFQYVIVGPRDPGARGSVKPSLNDCVEIIYIDVDKPSADYFWHLAPHCFSPAGHRFECRVVEEVEKAVSLMRAEPDRGDEASARHARRVA